MLPEPIATTDIVLPFKATAVPWRATIDWVNLLNLGLGLAGLSVLVASLLVVLSFPSSPTIRLILIVALVYGLANFVLNLWGIYSLAIVVTADDVQEHVAFRKQSFAWDTIQAVKLTDRVKRIILWRNGKKAYLQCYGFDPDDIAKIEALIRAQMQTRQVSVS